MEETAALLASSVLKQRFAGVSKLLEQLRTQKATSETADALITHVLPCIRDHNSKIALGALEILEQLLLAPVADSTLRSTFKLLWTSVVERLGDSKMNVRQKAVDVAVAVSLVLDVSTVLEKLQLCMKHKNWRTREQVLKLLEDSSKDVRDAAMIALEKFYAYIGSSLLNKNLRAGQMKTLEKRFENISKSSGAIVRATLSDGVASVYHGAFDRNDDLPHALPSKMSSYDTQAPSSSSSSVARYLESVRHRSSEVVQDVSLPGTSSDDISDKEIHKQLGVVFDKLQRDNDWDKRVDGLKILQKLANRCAKRGAAISLLSQGLRPIRERLCQQVIDLRSSVSKEACETIQILARTLTDEFNAHAEICLGNLLKATYVTIQVISTAADTTIRAIIESTSNGYTRLVPKLIECASSRNHVLRFNAVCYLTLTLQRWSVNFLSKYDHRAALCQLVALSGPTDVRYCVRHSDLFVPIMPVILRDALGDVRAQSRKCYWSFRHVFPAEAKSIFSRLDGPTQKNLRDDSLKSTAQAARLTTDSSLVTPAPPNGAGGRSALRTTNSAQPATSALPALNSVTFDVDEQAVQRDASSQESAAGKLPRRVFEGSLGLQGVDANEESAQTSRVLSQRPLRVGHVALAKPSVSKDGFASENETKKSTVVGPLRVRNIPASLQTASATNENLGALRQEPLTAGSQTNSNPVSKVQRVQRTVEPQAPIVMEIEESGPKRLLVASVASPTASNASSSRTNVSLRDDSIDNKPKRAVLTKSSERLKAADLLLADYLEEALRKIDSESWSTRLESVEFIGKLLRERVDQVTNGTGEDHKVDGRILIVFIKHLSDAHYRVSQGVLKSFLPLLQLCGDKHVLVPHLKSILPKLFQKFIDTKDVIRMIAKENLEHITSTVDSSTLAAIMISLLGDGSNMKIKAAMCHYLRELLPRAEGYMKNGINNSHMRSFLLRIALLIDAEVPVSVSSACGELVSVVAQLYASEMEAALGLLPPSKRSVVAKVLKSKKIVLDCSNRQSPLFSSADPQKTWPQNGNNNNYIMEKLAPKSERSRKRPESPNVDSFDSARLNDQKKINVTSRSVFEGRTNNRSVSQGNEDVVRAVAPLKSIPSCGSLFSCGETTLDKHGTELEDILHFLEEKNMSEAEIMHVLYRTMHAIKTTSCETWNRCFGRLLLLLLDAATEKDARALKVLQELVAAQPSRAQMFSELLFQRLIDAIVDQDGVVSLIVQK
uniref:TOG domain-containing protein n=1 Tax=Hyaloperonospora arabidopsidis (strain Emoy2) TaxID=559515 RepID=M4BY66_HYAAE